MIGDRARAESEGGVGARVVRSRARAESEVVASIGPIERARGAARGGVARAIASGVW